MEDPREGETQELERVDTPLAPASKPARTIKSVLLGLLTGIVSYPLLWIPSFLALGWLLPHIGDKPSAYASTTLALAAVAVIYRSQRRRSPGFADGFALSASLVSLAWLVVLLAFSGIAID